MLKRRRKEPAEGTGINLTPVLGLAFILVLVFVAAVPFAQERGIAQSNCDCGHGHGTHIILAVDSQNRVFIEGDDGRRQIDVRAVRTIVKRFLAENPKSAALIQAQKQSDMGTVIRVIDEAKQARAEPPVPVSIAAVD